MVVAQQLYETGYITYMRTDSVNLSQMALSQAQKVIKENFGKEYGLEQPRYYTNKSKGAQEAHEAIRPTDLSLAPDSLKNGLDRNQFKIYDVVWKRALASQMATAVFDQTTTDIKTNNNFTFRASGQVVKFDGFLYGSYNSFIGMFSRFMYSHISNSVQWSNGCILMWVLSSEFDLY